MKKFVGIIVATVLAFSLVGCGPVDSAIQNIASSGSNTSSKSGVVTADDDGYAEGRMGDVMRTYFFDYTVNSAYTLKFKSLAGVAPDSLTATQEIGRAHV